MINLNDTVAEFIKDAGLYLDTQDQENRLRDTLRSIMAAAYEMGYTDAVNDIEG